MALCLLVMKPRKGIYLVLLETKFVFDLGGIELAIEMFLLSYELRLFL